MVFPRLVYQGTKKAVATGSLMHTFPIVYNLTTSQPLYPTAWQPSWRSPCARQHGCVVVISPWAQGCRFLPWDWKIFPTQGRDPLLANRSSLSCWQHAKLMLIKSMWLIPLDINCCPSLRRRLDLAASKLHQFRKQGHLLWTSWLNRRVFLILLFLWSLCKSF